MAAAQASARGATDWHCWPGLSRKLAAEAALPECFVQGLHGFKSALASSVPQAGLPNVPRAS